LQKKAKSRYPNYVASVQKMGHEAVKLHLPNGTRVTGTHLMYMGAVISRWNLFHYWNQKDMRANTLGNDDFILVAELEAVLWTCAQLSKLVQTNMFGSNSYSFFHVLAFYVTYAMQKR
jgi:hypothetical protein